MLNYLNSLNRINLNESKQRNLKIMSNVKLLKRPKGHLWIGIPIELPSGPVLNCETDVISKCVFKIFKKR